MSGIKAFLGIPVTANFLVLVGNKILTKLCVKVNTIFIICFSLLNIQRNLEIKRESKYIFEHLFFAVEY